MPTEEPTAPRRGNPTRPAEAARSFAGAGFGAAVDKLFGGRR